MSVNIWRKNYFKPTKKKVEKLFLSAAQPFNLYKTQAASLISFISREADEMKAPNVCCGAN